MRTFPFSSSKCRALFVLATFTSVSGTATAQNPLFRTADGCMACHNGLQTSTGDDISFGFAWRSSMMANAARDPYWHASVRRETLDHPSMRAPIEDECSACHMPMARFHDAQAGGKGQVFANLPPAASPMSLLARDGVSCTLCHQITSDKLGTPASFTAGFVIDSKTPMGSRSALGPFSVAAGQTRIMRSASQFVPTQATHLRQSEVCATCHTLITTAFGPDGKAIGELPEQVPYQEWQHSAFRDRQSCQSCHMPVVDESTAISSVLGQPREGVSRHDFRGGNFFMPRLLNSDRTRLGVTALPQELDTTARRARDLLAEKAARLALFLGPASEGQLDFEVAIENLAGHKLPTGYPSRRSWLHVTVRDSQGQAIFESGALGPDGRIAGNDNDGDPTRFEAHYQTITQADQVQIYETILGDPRGAVTTGLLTAVQYLKDNRILPSGFDKTTADKQIAVHGDALADNDFAGGSDRVHFHLNLGQAKAPLSVEAELLYQPIGYRWAHNLSTVPAAEPARFVELYRQTARASATRLAQERLVVR
jgi:hypothetical protein